jgi:tetratricopeptide (TPR) repeat protein
VKSAAVALVVSCAAVAACSRDESRGAARSPTTLAPSAAAAAAAIADARAELVVDHERDPGRARRRLESTFGDAPSEPEAALLLARAAFRLEDRAACDRALDAYFAHAPRDRPDWSAEATLVRGWLCERAGEFERALELDDQALALVPTYVWGFHRKGCVLGELGRVDAAIECEQKAVAAQPGFVEAHFTLAGLLRRAGRTAEAEHEAKLHRLLNLTTENSSHEPNAIAERLDAYSQLESLLPQWVEGRIEYAKQQYSARQGEAAIARLEKLVRERPDVPAAWLTLGEVTRRTRGEPAALELLRRTLDATPNVTADSRAAVERVLAGPRR